jgi:hypothetical protein
MMTIGFRKMLAGISLCGVIVAPAASRAEGVIARWIQLAPGSSPAALAAGSWGDQPTSLKPTVLARAIISGGACPALTLDHGNHQIPMTKRFDAGALTGLDISFSKFTDYPTSFVSHTEYGAYGNGDAWATTDWTECEAVVPNGHEVVKIGDVELKLPVEHPKRILVFGDSGCRLNSGAPAAGTGPSTAATAGAQQNCHDPNAWPFRFMANYEALYHPDLIVHVGDYFYRDSGCWVSGAEFVAGCSDPTNANYEQWGDTFDTWNSDFFFPGKSLLAAAPWVMTRGNHESCGRGARGWYALLDPAPFDKSLLTCKKNAGAAVVSGNTPVYSGDFRPTYVVPAGSVNFLVHDSSFANDSAVDANMAKNYALDLTAVLDALPKNELGIYTTHKPAYGAVAGAPTSGGDFTEQFTFSGNSSPGDAFAGGTVPQQIALLLSGHIHQFEYVSFADNTAFAPQLTVGTGGDNLDATANPDGVTPTYGYQDVAFTIHNNANTSTTTTATVSRAFSQAAFGYAVLDATPTGYIATIHSLGSTGVDRCVITLNPRRITCRR